MTVKSIGNRGAYYSGSGNFPQGNGIRNVSDLSIATMSLTGALNDVVYIPANMLTVGGKLYQGYAFQSDCGCTVEYTLQNAGLACSTDPNVQATVKWANSLTVPNTAVITASTVNIFSAIKITFTAAGNVYIVGR